ncbi:unnamed protein product [marine sediment metagenome]|uniref:Uncharacterized protein n=1 Tax=marine sediment metagenome TaxID=412755 RepID=X0STJ7_9ZZZZ
MKAFIFVVVVVSWMSMSIRLNRVENKLNLLISITEDDTHRLDARIDELDDK